MKIFTMLKKITLMAVLLIYVVPVYTEGEEYKWLKSPGYEKIFVYTDFNNCDFIGTKLNETIKRTLSRYDIKAAVSDSLAFQTTVKRDKIIREEIAPELISDNKIILYIYGKCVEYNSAYIYQFDIRFAVYNKKYSQALLYSSPQHNVMGVDTFTGIDRTFRKLMTDSVEDYISANKAK